MTTNEEILNKASEINQRIVSENEEKEVIEVIDNSPVYVLEESIPDILSINDLNKVIDEITTDIKDMEDQISALENSRNDLAKELEEIDTSKHVNEVSLKMTDVREIDQQLKDKRAVLEDYYFDLRKRTEDRDALDKTSRELVIKTTNERNALAKELDECKKKYIETADFNYYTKFMDIADQLNEYKEFESFEAISIIEDKEEKKEETKKEEKVEEKIEDKPEVKEEVVSELSEVKVDALPEEEKKEEIKEEIVSEPVKEETELEISLDDLLSNAGPIEEPKTEVKPLLTSRIDKIADSNKKGIKSTINVFNPQKNESKDSTLTLVA